MHETGLRLQREEELRKEKEQFAAVLPWLYKARDAQEAHFDQTATCYLGKARSLRPEQKLSIDWQESLQRSLHPVQFSTPRLPEFTAAAFDPKSRTLIAGGDGTAAALHRWDVATLRENQTYSEGYTRKPGDDATRPTALAVEPGGERFVVAFTNGDLLVYQTATGKLLHKETKAHTLPNHPVFAALPIKIAVTVLAWSRDGKQFVSVGFDHSLKLWDAASYKLLDSWEIIDPERKVPELRKFAVAPVTAAVFEADNTHLVTGADDGTLLRWDVKTHQVVQSVSGHDSLVQALALSRDGKWLASGGQGDVILWDWQRKQLVRRIHLAPLMSGRFGGRQQDAGSVALLGELSAWIASLAFSPDAGLLAVTQVDGSVSVLDTVVGTVVHRALGHKLPTMLLDPAAYCFFTDDFQLLTAGGDGQVCKWDLSLLSAGVKQRTLELRTLAVSRDGEWAGSAGMVTVRVLRGARPMPMAAHSPLRRRRR